MVELKTLSRLLNYIIVINKNTNLRASYILNNSFLNIRIYRGKEELINNSFEDIYSESKELEKKINVLCDVLHIFKEEYKIIKK